MFIFFFEKRDILILLSIWLKWVTVVTVADPGLQYAFLQKLIVPVTSALQ